MKDHSAAGHSEKKRSARDARRHRAHSERPHGSIPGGWLASGPELPEALKKYRSERKKCHLRIPHFPKDVPKRPQTAAKGLQKEAREVPQEAPRGPKRPLKRHKIGIMRRNSENLKNDDILNKVYGKRNVLTTKTKESRGRVAYHVAKSR